MERLGVIRDIICRLTGARAVIHRGPQTVPKILSQWSSPVILGLGILPEHGLGILTVPWTTWTIKPRGIIWFMAQKGKGNRYMYIIFGTTGTSSMGWDCDTTPAINPWVYAVPEG